jgi:small subunit ribosomal protein S17
MEKSVIVEIVTTYRHPLYKKVVHSHNRIMAHDELGSQVGDEVRIVECRPISRRKRWAVEAILRENLGAREPELEV